MKLYQCQESFDLAANGSIKTINKGEYYSWEVVESYISKFMPSNFNMEGLLLESQQNILETCNILCKTKELFLG